MNKIQQQLRQSEEEFDETLNTTIQFYNETDVGGYIKRPEDYIREIDPDGIKAFIKTSQENLLKAVIAEIEENGVGHCAHAYNNAIIDVKNLLQESLNHE